MSAEGESSSTHAVVSTDTPGTASTVDNSTNNHSLNSFNNIDQSMGQMVGLIAKFCEARRPGGRKRSIDPSSDTAESESYLKGRHSNTKRAREISPSDDDLSPHAQDDVNDDENVKPLPTNHRPPTIGQAWDTPAPAWG